MSTNKPVLMTFHELWGLAQGERHYDKRKWMELQAALQVDTPSQPVETLANRDPKEGPPVHWYSIDRETMLAFAETSAEGDVRYGVDNWRKGLPVSQLVNHAMDHLFKALEGDATEPHIKHAMWNLGKILWMARNKPEMVDVPMIRKSLGLGE